MVSTHVTVIFGDHTQGVAVRKLAMIVLGASVLSVGLLPTVAFADSAPSALVAAAAQAAADPSATPEAPTPTATTDPTPTADPADPADPGDDYLIGDFTRTPAYGPPGTVITVKSTDPCVDSKGKVGPAAELFFLSGDPNTDDFGLVADKVLSTDKSGAWSTTVKAPKTAKDGDIYYLIAACFSTDKIDDNTDPFLIYNQQAFMVTKADKAPVATPVPGNPNFTG
jgi:hypothetical protein